MSVSRSNRHYSIRWLLPSFAVLVTIPLIILLAYLLYKSAVTERAQLEQRLQRVAANIADDVERDFDRRIALLKTLATSPLVASQNWGAFYDQAKAALQDRAYLVLVDAEGRQLVNTFVPFGTEPPFTGDPETVKRIASSRQPVVSDLFVSLVVKRPVFNISIPVLTDDKVRYVMSLGLLPTDILSILTAQQLDPSWVLSIWDRGDIILARTHDHEKWVGQTLPTRLKAAELKDGVFRSISLDDESVVRSIARIATSGWRVSVSLPATSADSAFQSTIWVLVGASFLSLGSAALLGYYGGKLMALPLTQAARAARAFGNGQDYVADKTFVREVNDLADALTNASQRQQILGHELLHRCKNILAVVQAIVGRSLADGRSIEDARSVTMDRLQALSRAHDLILKYEWRGAELGEIAKAELEPFGKRIDIEGRSCMVAADLVQPLMLVLHELATNAVKYGALSNANGRVKLSWLLAPDSNVLVISWVETGGPQIAATSRKGFGSRLLERAVPGGIAELQFGKAGFSYKIEIALSKIPRDPSTEIHADQSNFPDA